VDRGDRRAAAGGIVAIRDATGRATLPFEETGRRRA
jgi:hypothetical protein